MIEQALDKLHLKSAPTSHLVLLVSMLLVITPHLSRMPIGLGIFCLFIIGWRFLYEAGKSRLPNMLVKVLLLAIAIFAVLTSYQTVVGKNAGAAVLVLMFCLKLTEFKSQRDAYVIVFLGFFIVVTGFLFSQSIPIAIYMIFVIIGLTTSLVAFQHTSFSQKAHLKLAIRMLLYSLPLAFVLFMFFPRATGPLWGLPSDAYSAKTGISDEMSPGKISRLSNSSAIAFRVAFSSKVPGNSQLYWRGPVLWSYDGSSWTSPRSDRLIVNKHPITGKSDPASYTITLQPHNNYWLFALDVPVKKIKGSEFTSELVMLAKKPLRKTIRYQLQSYTSYTYEALDFLSFSRYLELPENSSPQTRQLVNSWKDAGLDKRQLVKRALNYFDEKEFYYSRSAPLLFDDPVDEFLFQTRKGYCEHFASSFTVMMRMAGIPARVVTGYLGGEMNPLGDYMIVRQSDAHAWSEVYLEGAGWVRIDPTAVIPPTRIENSDDVVRMQPQSDIAITILNDTNWLQRSYKNISNLVDSINNRWNQWVIGYNDKKQVALFEALGIPEITWRGLSVIMFSLLGILLAIFSYYLLINRTRLDAVNAAYLQFCKKMQKLGFTKQVSETSNDFAKRIISKNPGLAVPVTKITSTYNSLHYGKYQTSGLVSKLVEQVKTLKV